MDKLQLMANALHHLFTGLYNRSHGLRATHIRVEQFDATITRLAVAAMS